VEEKDVQKKSHAKTQRRKELKSEFVCAFAPLRETDSSVKNVSLRIWCNFGFLSF
jgi:hypothetical protein